MDWKLQDDFNLSAARKFLIDFLPDFKPALAFFNMKI